MKKLLVFVLLILTGCGTIPRNRLFYNVDPELSSYFRLFEEKFNISANNITAGFTELEDPVAGVCISWSDGEREIQVDSEYWKETSGSYREELVFHELLHCTINAKHNQAEYSDGCPMSIMFDTNFGNPCYILHDYFSEFRH